MKRILLIILGVILLFDIPLTTVYADGVSDTYEEVNAQIDELLSDFDIGFTADQLGNLSFGDIFWLIRSEVSAHINAPLRLLGTLFLVILSVSVMNVFAGEGLTGSLKELNELVGTMTSMLVIAPVITEIYNDTLITIHTAGSYILVFVPIFCSLAVICGSAVSAGFFHFAILTASELLVRLADSFLMPLLCLCIYLGVCGSIFSGKNVSAVSDILQKAINRSITVAVAAFTGFVSLKCSVASKADGLGAKAVKSAISGFVPIVGSAVSDAYGTVRGSFSLINSTVGFIGIAAITIIILPKIIELLLFRAVLNIGITAAELFSAGSVSGLLRCFDGGISVVLCIMVCHSMIFLICTGMILQTL